MLPSLVFWHPSSQSGTGAFCYQSILVPDRFGIGAFRFLIGSHYSGTGLGPASAFLFIPVPLKNKFYEAKQKMRKELSDFLSLKRKKGFCFTSKQSFFEQNKFS
jgi:hypothetical protein